MIRIFLGGTCNGSRWRDEFRGLVDYECYDPTVSSWSLENIASEDLEKEKCDFLLYVITPLMDGFYSIAEVVDDSNKWPHKTQLVILDSDEGKTFSEHQRKSIKAVARIVRSNGARVFYSLNEAATFLSSDLQVD